jgi:hypothetical protein
MCRGGECDESDLINTELKNTPIEEVGWRIFFWGGAMELEGELLSIETTNNDINTKAINPSLDKNDF